MQKANLITSMAWVAWGRSPPNIQKVKYTQEDLAEIIKEMKLKDQKSKLSEFNPGRAEYESRPDAKKCPTSIQDDSESENDENDYDWGNYDNEPDEAMSNQPIETLILENKPDSDSEDSDAEPDEFTIQPSDNLILAGHVDDDISMLEVYVFNNSNAELFLLHDILLPSQPMAIEWGNYAKKDNPSGVRNLAAVGYMDPEINIWDLNVSGSLEPLVRLSGPKSKKAHRHTDSVLSLAWNRENCKLLASGSVDKTVRLWDLESETLMQKFTHFEGYIQSVQWHPMESQLLLTGSADSKVKLFDCRGSDLSKDWTLDGSVEQILWNPFGYHNFFASTDKGFIGYYDIRNDKEPIWNIKAHDDECVFTISSGCMDFFVSASHDETVKVWDLKHSNQPELVLVKHMNIGPIYTIKANPNVPYVFCAGGMKKDNYMYVWDSRESESVMERFGEKDKDGKITVRREKNKEGENFNLESFPKLMETEATGDSGEPTAGPSSGARDAGREWGQIKLKRSKKSKTSKLVSAVRSAPDVDGEVAGPSSGLTPQTRKERRDRKKMHPKTKQGEKKKKKKDGKK